MVNKKLSDEDIVVNMRDVSEFMELLTQLNNIANLIICGRVRMDSNGRQHLHRHSIKGMVALCSL